MAAIDSMARLRSRKSTKVVKPTFEAEPSEALDLFALIRRANLRLLGRASASDLERVGVHVERGDESLAHIRRLHAGHDLLHLRQIERIRRAVA